MKINSLIKVWGSLISQKKSFTNLIDWLENISKNNKIVLTTGSKDISDIIRDRLIEIIGNKISIKNHIDITWKSRDIVSQSVCDINDRLKPVFNISDIGQILKRWEIPVIIQYEILKKLQPFSLKRGLSTDTTSAFFSEYLWAKNFIKLTDVNGVYDENKKVISEISTSDLQKMWKTCIDITLASYLEQIKQICYVLNGNNKENLEQFYQNWTWIYTKVVPK